MKQNIACTHTLHDRRGAVSPAAVGSSGTTSRPQHAWDLEEGTRQGLSLSSLLSLFLMPTHVPNLCFNLMAH